ncbi:MAG: N-acetyltransferase [Azospirillum brasilense]|nr:MAG: N-acetyltransferase [Azospirillum brasilense]
MNVCKGSSLCGNSRPRLLAVLGRHMAGCMCGTFVPVCYVYPMSTRIAAVSEQPELASLVARWRVQAFFTPPGGYTVDEMTALILKPPGGPNKTFVLFDDDRPVGTAGLMRGDLESRPDLTPWLGGLYVEPAFRSRGHATTLVRQVEDAARAVSVSVLWLYTLSADGLYLRLGWQHAGLEQEDGRDVMLMRRDLT